MKKKKQKKLRLTEKYLKTNITSAKCPIPDVRQSSEQTSEYNLDLDKIKRSKAEYLRCQTSEMESPIKKSTTKI